MENFKILKNGKKITCGIIIIDKDNNILAGHPTGKKYDKECYDILKGCCDNGEEELDCAIRELYEESGYIIKDKENIIDLGIIDYKKDKDIHLFLYRINKMPDLKTLKCISYFETDNGRSLPEMNGYKVISKNERYLFYKSIQRVLKNIKEIN